MNTMVQEKEKPVALSGNAAIDRRSSVVALQPLVASAQAFHGGEQDD